MNPLEHFALAPGFHGAATSCGLKLGGALDLALIRSAESCSAAGLFTTNRVKAAPVVYDAEILARNPEEMRALIANSGCANACTGVRGMSDARRMAECVAGGLGCRPEQVLVLSTGVIGRPLDMERVAAGIARLTARGAVESPADVARAILTTDTHPKTTMREVRLSGTPVVIRGLAKGAGMIHPNLATMLAVVTTDARISHAPLQAALRFAVARSFNRLSVDGDMSTNDTVLALASGASGVEVRGADLDAFAGALTDVCASLARQIARDGEGATRLVEIRVSGALDEDQAHAVADAIARSTLVRTAIHGGDPNWGRVLAAAGSSRAVLDPERLTLSFGEPPDQVCVVERGLPTAVPEPQAAAKLAVDPVHVALDLGLGDAETTLWTCDLSAQYVEINAHYTT